MAYVRTTQTLIDEMTRHVEQMRDQAMSPYADSPVDSDVATRQHIIDSGLKAAWSLAPELQATMPHEWSVEIEDVRFNFVDENDVAYKSVRFDVSPKMRVPRTESYSYYCTDINVRHEHCAPELMEWLQGEEERKTKREEIKAQYGTIRSQIKEFMRQHASLNAALKEMPELEMYVPQSYMDKVNATSPKRKKKDAPTVVEDLGIDRDVFAAVAIAHRVTTSGN